MKLLELFEEVKLQSPDKVNLTKINKELNSKMKEYFSNSFLTKLYEQLPRKLKIHMIKSAKSAFVHTTVSSGTLMIQRIVAPDTNRDQKSKEVGDRIFYPKTRKKINVDVIIQEIIRLIETRKRGDNFRELSELKEEIVRVFKVKTKEGNDILSTTIKNNIVKSVKNILPAMIPVDKRFNIGEIVPGGKLDAAYPEKIKTLGRIIKKYNVFNPTHVDKMVKYAVENRSITRIKKYNPNSKSSPKSKDTSTTNPSIDRGKLRDYFTKNTKLTTRATDKTDIIGSLIRYTTEGIRIFKGNKFLKELKQPQLALVKILQAIKATNFIFPLLDFNVFLIF